MRSIDLNADLGEGGTQDVALIALVSSANIACGGHAGDEASMRAAVEACITAGVAIGAHPGYEDPEHFGRRALEVAPELVASMVVGQVSRIHEIAGFLGGGVHHVKPHGALYTQADRDPSLAAAVAGAVAQVIPGCGFYVPPTGGLAAAGKKAGLRVRAEGFVDRRYSANGSLVARCEPGAVIEDVDEAVAQALEIACEQRVRTVAGSFFPMPATTLCVHGDSENALEMLCAVRRAVDASGFAIRA